MWIIATNRQNSYILNPSVLGYVLFPSEILIGERGGFRFTKTYSHNSKAGY